MSLKSTRTLSSKRSYPFLPLILFITTYFLVQFYHYDPILFGYSLAVILSTVGIGYAINALKTNSDHLSTTMMDVDQMDEEEYQQLLISLFQRQGYSVKRVKKIDQTAVSLILKRRGVNTIVQTKRADNQIEKQSIQEALTMKPIYQATHVIVVTTATFTQEAKRLAHANKVNLIDHVTLEAMIDAYVPGHPFIQRARTLFASHERNEN